MGRPADLSDRALEEAAAHRSDLELVDLERVYHGS
jgi:hypothetical protein